MKIPPLIHKGNVKPASDIEVGDFINLTGNLFDVVEVIEVTSLSDINDLVTIKIKARNGILFFENEVSKDYLFPLYETYPQKG